MNEKDAMTERDVVGALPGLLDEIEAHRGQGLTTEEIGKVLKDIGEAIANGQFGATAASVSPQYGACTCPTIVSNNPNTGRISHMLCLCPSC